MARIVLVPNLSTLLLTNAEVEYRLTQIAFQVLELAKQLVPKETHALENSGHVEVSTFENFFGMRVVFGNEEVDYAVYVEFGTIDTPTFAFLRRAGESVGTVSRQGRGLT